MRRVWRGKRLGCADLAIRKRGDGYLCLIRSGGTCKKDEWFYGTNRPCQMTAYGSRVARRGCSSMLCFSDVGAVRQASGRIGKAGCKHAWRWDPSIIFH